jgi:hypothetical protein
METGIERVNRINQERREAGITFEVENNLVVKAKNKPSSLRAAISAMCFQCFGGTETEMPDPGWRKYIGTCTAPDCALWPHRPYKTDSDQREEDAEAVSKINDQG